jgi:SNF2 family DNA or RNA helicase
MMKRTAIAVGTKVQLKGQRDKIGTITSPPKVLNNERWYKVFFSANEESQYPESSLELFVGTQDIETLFKKGCYGSKENFSRLLTYTKLCKPLSNYIYSFLASRTESFPFQFRPLIKFLGSVKRRLLIADEVGLGKTIEAGLILTELKARENLNRVLIVCRSNLIFKWHEEMRRRFDEEFEILDSAKFSSLINRSQEAAAYVRTKAICSLEFLRMPARLNALLDSGLNFDLVIFDEAHYMRNTGTRSNILGRELGDIADSMLFLTATPVHLGNENLFNLLRILDPEEFDSMELFANRLHINKNLVNALRILEHSFPADFQECRDALIQIEKTDYGPAFLKNPIYTEVLKKMDVYESNNREQVIEVQRDIASLNLLGHVVTRTRKRDVIENRPVRTARVQSIEFTNAELEFYNAVTRYVQDRAGSGVFSQFVAMMPQRQMASCIPAMIEYYKNLFNNDNAILTEENSDIDIDDNGSTPSSNEDFAPRRDSSFIKLIKESGEKITSDSKFDCFINLLDEIEKTEPGRKVVVFSYFRKTLAYLNCKLCEKGYKTEIIHGGIVSNPSDPDHDERALALKRFWEDPDIKVLLSSEVGSEGIDLQISHIVINYDLPWNPMTVEQRIGRVDRLGQESNRILICNLSIKGTIEEKILKRLYARIGIFQESIGDLEDILGDEINILQRELLTSRLTDSEVSKRIEQTAQALVKKRQEQRKLEVEGKNLVGHNAFFDEEINRILKRKRYLTDTEIYILVSEFLRRNYPRAELKVIKSMPKCYELIIPDDLYELIRQRRSLEDPLVIQFLAKSSRGRVTVTFDSDRAYRKPEIEFLYFHHPLVRVIVDYYEKHKDEISPVTKIEIMRSEYPSGDYYFFVYLVKTYALIPGYRLETIIVSRDNQRTYEQRGSEAMLSFLIEKGKTFAEEPPDNEPERKAMLDASSELISKRIKEWEKKLIKRNSAQISQKREAIRQSYERKIQRREAELEKGILEGWQEKRLQIPRGALRNLKAELNEKMHDLNAAEQVSISHNLISCGFIRVMEKT